MHIDHLEARNLHGRLSFSHHLSPCSLVLGPNEGGKSTALGLIELVLSGPRGSTWPVLGDSPDYDWSAALRFDTGSHVERRVMRGKHEVLVNGKLMGPQSAPEAITELCGSAATWTLESLVDLAPAKRTAWLDSNVFKGASWTGQALSEAIQALHDDPTDPWNAATLLAVLPGLGTPTESGRPISQLVRWALQQQDGRAALNEIKLQVDIALTKADQELRACNALVKDMPAEAPKREGKTVPMLREEQAQLRVQIDQLNQRIGTAREASARAEKLEADIKDVTERQQQAARDGKLDDGLRSARELAQQANQEVHERTMKLTQLKAELTRAQAESTAIEAQLRDAKHAVAMAEQAHQELVERRKAIAGASGLSKATATVLARATPELMAREEYQALAAEHGAVADLLGQVDMRPAAEALGAARKNLEQLVKRSVTASTALRECQAAVDGQQVHVDDSQKRMTDASGTIRRLEERQRTAVQRSHELDLGRRRLQEELNGLVIEPLQSMSDQLDALAARDRELTTAINAGVDADAAEVQRLATYARLDKARTARREAFEASKGVATLLGQQLRELTAGVVVPASRITESVLGARFDLDLENGARFRLVREKQVIPIDRVAKGQSRSPSMIGLAALRTAVIQSFAGFKIVVLDDLEAIEVERRGAFLAAMKAEVDAGHIDQFLGACVWDGWHPAELATILQVTR